ncbi:hypothetical protein BHE90_017122 [Fusarium euwallaceae]|uniref:Uncharacterized protein n=3 Tax=Fusarium solani species complex TaxID=232080 RepID=A0A3M2S287_9HYPO|nr:hypothetical protein CDV36_008726 [Fusarium kuroshium]RSL78732.1 hypothetical protein CEP51_007946 [Fusarium floridanum]RTE68501.1 hypothetical protein BHE90_017122 [Fusarium euwallaceae]
MKWSITVRVRGVGCAETGGSSVIKEHQPVEIALLEEARVQAMVMFSTRRIGTKASRLECGIRKGAA